MWDFKIPCALLVTPQLASRMDAVEEQTDWRSGQFKRRVECWTNLPEKLTEADLRAVARSRAPLYTAEMIDEMVDFATPARRQMDAMIRAISGAEFFASEEGRSKITTADLLAGIKEAQQTDLFLTTKLDMERQTRRGQKTRRGTKRPLPQSGSAAAADLPPLRGSVPADDFLSDESAPTDRLSGHELAET